MLDRPGHSVFITASGTGVGKTLVTAALGHQLNNLGRPVQLLKPVLTGYPPSVAGEIPDCDVLLEVLDLPLNDSSRDSISPWRFQAPLSPDMAAAKQGRVIEFDAVCEFCRQPATGTLQLIEGIGGVMVPLTEQHTVLDWIIALDIPSVLVVGSYLGTISHTLTALGVLNQRSAPLLGIVVSESADGSVSLQDTCATLANFWSGPIVSVPRLTGSKPWQSAPDLTGILEPILSGLS